MSSAVITAALTGPIATKADNPSLPTTPEEIAAAAVAAHDGGAAVVHVHIRDQDGRPTADLEIARRTIGLIEQACPALIQLSTGVGLTVPFEARERLVEARPRMATLNVCSMTFGAGEFRNPPDGVRRLAERMGELAIKPELEVYDTGHLEVALMLHSEGLLAEPLQFSFVLGVRGGAAATAANLLAMIDRLPEGAIWQVIAIGRANLELTAIGLALGGNARTGMEDTLTLRRGVPVRSNAELVGRLVAVARALEREPAGVEETERLLSLPGRADLSHDLFVAAGHIFCPDGSLLRADVQITDGMIVAVGAGLDPAPGAKTLDASSMLIAPGLINAHMHSGENFNPGLYENLPLDLWFVRSHQITRDEPPSREAIYVRTLLGAMLMLRSGTTTAVDFLYEAPQITLETLEPVVAAYRDAGLRATILLGVADLPYLSSLPLTNAGAASALEAPAPTREEIMALARAAVDRFHEPGGLIGIGLGPSAPQRCSPELMQETMELARDRELVWQTHVQETRTQVLTARSRHGRSFVEALAEQGLLGQAATLVHTVWLTDHDIELMRASGTRAVHCLLSNLRLGDGVARLPALLRAGVRVALGTDGRGCMETLDMLELARMTALVHKVRGRDFRRWPTALDALRMATSDASPCAGHGERLGRIEPGARGDLILIPRDVPAFTPLHQPARQLVYGASAGDVHTVVVDGRVVVRDGSVLGIDRDWLMSRVEPYSAEALAGERGADADTLERLAGEAYAWADQAQLELDAYLNS